MQPRNRQKVVVIYAGVSGIVRQKDRAPILKPMGNFLLSLVGAENVTFGITREEDVRKRELRMHLWRPW